MTRIFLIIACAISLLSCNDGDIFVSELNFPETLEYCEGNTDLIIYSIKENPYESLSIKLPLSDKDNFTAVIDPAPTTEFSSTNTFNYRSYTGDPSNIFCNSLPPTSPVIISNYTATTGSVQFTTTFTEEDDNDGIPANLEDDNNDGDDNHLTNPRDTDSDGIPDYLDSDDDGDNVPTANENPDPNGDGDLSDAQDTDGDSIPDFLDPDDDGDGTITRYEDTDGDHDPTTDISAPATEPDYLNANVTESTTYDAYLDHTQTRNFTCVITIIDAILINSATSEDLVYENRDIGTINTVVSDYSYEVSFN